MKERKDFWIMRNDILLNSSSVLLCHANEMTNDANDILSEVFSKPIKTKSKHFVF